MWQRNGRNGVARKWLQCAYWRVSVSAMAGGYKIMVMANEEM